MGSGPPLAAVAPWGGPEAARSHFGRLVRCVRAATVWVSACLTWLWLGLALPGPPCVTYRASRAPPASHRPTRPPDEAAPGGGRPPSALIPEENCRRQDRTRTHCKRASLRLMGRSTQPPPKKTKIQPSGASAASPVSPICSVCSSPFPRPPGSKARRKTDFGSSLPSKTQPINNRQPPKANAQSQDDDDDKEDDKEDDKIKSQRLITSQPPTRNKFCDVQQGSSPSADSSSPQASTCSCSSLLAVYLVSPLPTSSHCLSHRCCAVARANSSPPYHSIPFLSPLSRRSVRLAFVASLDSRSWNQQNLITNPNSALSALAASGSTLKTFLPRGLVSARAARSHDGLSNPGAG